MTRSNSENGDGRSSKIADLKESLSCDQDAKLTAIDRLARFFTMYGRLILSECGVCLALVSDRSLNPQSRRRLRALKRQFEIEVQKILDAGRADGTIRVDDPKMSTVAIFGAFNWAPQWFSKAGPSTPDQITAAIFGVFRKAMKQGCQRWATWWTKARSCSTTSTVVRSALNDL